MRSGWSRVLGSQGRATESARDSRLTFWANL